MEERMEREEDIIERDSDLEENTAPEEQAALQEATPSGEQEKSEEKVPGETEQNDSTEKVQDTRKLKDAIQKNKDVIDAFNDLCHGLKIDNKSGIVAGDGATFGNIYIQTGSGKKDFENGIADKPEQLEEWITEHYGQFDVVFLIACAVFHDMPYSWINDASEKLYDYLGEKEKNNEGKIARAQSIRTFGAEICQGTINTYTGQIEVECIRFSKKEQVNNILKTIWNEFSQMRRGLVLWLKKYIIKEKRIMSERARDVLGYLAGLDYYYFSHKMIEQIIQKRSVYDDLVLAQITVVLYQQTQYKSNLDNMLKNWAKLKNAHYLLTTMLVCVIVEGQNECLQYALHTYIIELFNAIQQRKDNEFRQNMLSFFAVGTRKVVFYRILIEELYKMAQQNNSVQGRNDMCTLFLELFCVDVMLSRFDEGVEDEALLVKLVSMRCNFRGRLCFLWDMVWRKTKYRMAFYDVLGQYFSLIPRQERKKKIRFFVNAALRGQYSEQNCTDFISKIEIKCKKYEA